MSTKWRSPGPDALRPHRCPCHFQVTLIKQEKVACLVDNDSHLALEPGNAFQVRPCVWIGNAGLASEQGGGEMPRGTCNVFFRGQGAVSLQRSLCQLMCVCVVGGREGLTPAPPRLPFPSRAGPDQAPRSWRRARPAPQQRPGGKMAAGGLQMGLLLPGDCMGHRGDPGHKRPRNRLGGKGRQPGSVNKHPAQAAPFLPFSLYRTQDCNTLSTTIPPPFPLPSEQDTNALVFRALIAALGVSARHNYDMNSLAVPRRAKEVGERGGDARVEGA